MPRFVQRSLPLLTLLLLALLVALPLWGPGIVNTRGGGDSPFLLQRLHQMVVNLRAGVFPVRWMPDAAYGLGYPFFSYYAALPYYLAALFVLAGLNLLTALKLTQTLGFLLAALAAYGWARRLLPGRVAPWLTAVAYTMAPFHLVNVYVRGDSLSEFYAFVFYPLILWGLDRAVRGERPPAGGVGWGRLLFPALAYAGLLLTHNISALIFTPFALLLLLLLPPDGPARRWRSWQGHRRALLALLVGLLLAAWFWLPALAESGYGQLGTVTVGYFHYSRHFRTLNLVQLRPLFDYEIAPSLEGRTPFAMGLFQALFALLGGLLLGREALGRRSRPATYLALGLLVATAMITPLSRPLWDHLPLLPLVQFPWRFLSVQALFAAAATGWGVQALVGRRPRGAVRWGGAGLVAGLLTLAVLLPLRPERLPIRADEVTRERLLLYELFTGNIGTTIRYEYLPRTLVPRPYVSEALIEPDAPPRAIPVAGDLQEAAEVVHRPTERRWRVRTGEGGATVAFPLLAWPGWRAWVDGRPVPTQAVEGSGYLALPVPPGEHRVRLALGRTPLRAAAEALSLLTGLVLLAGVGRKLLTRKRGRGRPARPTLGPGAIPLALLVPALALLILLEPPPPPADDADLTMDFVAMPYLHHNPRGGDFAGAARLLGYTLSTERLTPGDPLTVTLRWAVGEPTGPLTVTVNLVSPAAHLQIATSPLLPPWTRSVRRLEGSGEQVHRLTLPTDLARGLYLLQVRLSGPAGELHAQTPGGAGQGILYLRPVRVVKGPPLEVETGILAGVGDAIRLHRATCRPTPLPLTCDLVWSTTRPLAANYGLSFRLYDGAGKPIVARDTQPGYGFLPTSLWRPGERITDRLVLPLPEGVPAGSDYRLVVILYRVATGEEVGRATLAGLTLPLTGPVTFEPPPRRFAPEGLPPASVPRLEVRFGDQVRLAGYRVRCQAGPVGGRVRCTSGERLALQLWWVAGRAPEASYTVFVHLFDPTTETIVAQDDALPRRGSYPTSWWAAGEVVSDTVTLDLAGVPPGRYRLAVGLYDGRTGERLPAFRAEEAPLPDARLVLPPEVEVLASP